MRITHLRNLMLGLLLALAPAASAATVEVTMSVDQAEILIDQTTTLHIFGEVTDGVVGNGIWAYALNVLTEAAGIVDMTAVQQLGSPDAFFSDAGSRDASGLRDVYGGDGGFLADANRGIGAPFELLTIDIQGLALGTVGFSAMQADISGLLGIADGFLLQQPGSLNVNFGDGAAVTVIPEPATLGLLGAGLAFMTTRRMRRPRQR